MWPVLSDHTASINISGLLFTESAGAGGGEGDGGGGRLKMLDKNLIKMQQVLPGLSQGKMLLSRCRIGLPELYKALLMAAEES